MYHGLSNPYDGSIIFLCKPILLWVVWNSEIPVYSYILVEIIEIIRGILTPIFGYENFDLLPYLVLQQKFELLKPAKDLILGIQEVDPSFAREVP